jgi:hypothetical protein
VPSTLRLSRNEKLVQDGIVCLALLHNEAHILPAFLDHYRQFGPVSFLVVDDRSNDGSAELLAAQPDVTVFNPQEGSSYAADKKAWRTELLDHYAPGQWCLVPDIDEHFIYRDMENRPITALIDSLQAEGSQALTCTMIDMYADKPLDAHIFTGGSLSDAFPYFDGDSAAPLGYRMMPQPKRYRAKCPTPSVTAFGGMRERLFFASTAKATAVQRWLLESFAHLGRPQSPGFIARITNAITRRAAMSLFPRQSLSCTKLGLLKWPKGATFAGGPHAIDVPMKVSEQRAVLLHYKFTKGAKGLKYTAQRGQHASGSAFYKSILSNDQAMQQSPVFAGSLEYSGSVSLGDLLG